MKRAKQLIPSDRDDKSDDQRQEEDGANWDDPGIPTSLMFYLQEVEFLGEFKDLAKTVEQRKFAESWMADRYVTSRAAALEMWI